MKRRRELEDGRKAFLFMLLRIYIASLDASETYSFLKCITWFKSSHSMELEGNELLSNHLIYLGQLRQKHMIKYLWTFAR